MCLVPFDSKHNDQRKSVYFVLLFKCEDDPAEKFLFPISPASSLRGEVTYPKPHHKSWKGSEFQV